MDSEKNIIAQGFQKVNQFVHEKGLVAYLGVSTLETVITILIATFVSFSTSFDGMTASENVFVNIGTVLLAWPFMYLFIYLLCRSYQICKMAFGVVLGNSVLNCVLSCVIGYGLAGTILISGLAFLDGIPVVGIILSVLFLAIGYGMCLLQICKIVGNTVVD